MAKVRVASRQVLDQLKKLGANQKRNIRAWKVKYGTQEKYFEEGKYAFRYASIECRHSLEKYEIYENAGGEEYILRAIYERGTALPVQRGRKPKTQNFILKQTTQEERWARAYEDTSVNVLVRKNKKAG